MLIRRLTALLAAGALIGGVPVASATAKGHSMKPSSQSHKSHKGKKGKKTKGHKHRGPSPLY